MTVHHEAFASFLLFYDSFLSESQFDICKVFRLFLLLFQSSMDSSYLWAWCAWDYNFVSVDILVEMLGNLFVFLSFSCIIGVYSMYDIQIRHWVAFDVRTKSARLNRFVWRVIIVTDLWLRCRREDEGRRSHRSLLIAANCHRGFSISLLWWN